MPKCLSPVRYPGGKTAAADQIKDYIPRGTPLLSPFFGGGSVEFNASSRGARVYGYDTYGPLVCFYENLKKNREALIEATLALHPLSDEKFEEIHSNLHVFPDDIEKAAAFFALNYTTHMSLMQSGGKSRSQDRFNPADIRRKLNFDMMDVTVELMDFRDSIAKHPDIFAFIDPPYIMKDKASEKFYGYCGSHHRDFNHTDLFNMLKDRGNWIMTHRDCLEIRDIYKDFPIDEKQWAYSMNNQIGQELIIKSLDHKASRPVFFGNNHSKQPKKNVSSANILRWLDVESTNNVAQSMLKAKLDIDSVVSNRHSVAIICGMPGLGKSHLLKNCDKRMKARNIDTIWRNFTHVRDLEDAIISAHGKKLIIADEADSMVRSSAQIELLKLLADQKFTGQVESGSGKNKRHLKLTCPIILAFNANTFSPNNSIQTQLDALFSRKRPVVLKGNREELWEYSVALALKSNLLKNIIVGGRNYIGSLSAFAKAIDIFTQNIWNLEEVSPRSLENIYKYICENIDGVISNSELEIEISSLMMTQPQQNAGLPDLEDWAELRRQMIQMNNMKNQSFKTKSNFMLPQSALVSTTHVYSHLN